MHTNTKARRFIAGSLAGDSCRHALAAVATGRLCCLRTSAWQPSQRTARGRRGSTWHSVQANSLWLPVDSANDASCFIDLLHARHHAVRIGDRRRPAGRAMAHAARARERRQVARRVGAVVIRVRARGVVLGAVTAVAVDRQIAERALALPLVARVALDDRVLAGQRHARAAVLLELRDVLPRDRGVALVALAVHPALVRIAVAAVARLARLRAVMTLGAGGLDVLAAQRKAGLVVIEAGLRRDAGELPALARVARAAVEALREAVVRIGPTRSTS